MIALPGLALVTGRVDVAKRVLAGFARHVDRRMIPNRFPDAGEAPEYNTVDGTLWFVEAVRALWQRSGDDDFVRTHLYDALADIVSWLLGPFITACLKVSGRTARARRTAAAWLSPFREHLRDAGVGQISEIFDGDPPYTARGCIAQAWSVGELLRVVLDELCGPAERKKTRASPRAPTRRLYRPN